MDKPEFVICPKCGATVQHSKYFNAYNCLTMFCDWSSFDPPELIKPDTHVYCTQCKWFRLDDEEIPYCFWEDECEIGNCEDSMRFEDRPKYESGISYERR